MFHNSDCEVLLKLFFNYQIAAPSFVMWAMFTVGGPKNLHKAKGGTKVFPRRQRGGPEKNGDRQSQTEGPPSP